MEVQECQSLEEVHLNINRIDESIIALIAERSNYVYQAARFKKTSQDAEAPKRVEDVIEKVKSLAFDNNLNPDIAEKVYRTMISAFIEQEKTLINNPAIDSYFFTPLDHINFSAKKLFKKQGEIIDGSIAYLEPNGGGPLEPHTHSHSHLFIVTEGQALVKLGNTEKILNKNEAYLVEGNLPHSIWNTTSSKCAMIDISILSK